MEPRNAGAVTLGAVALALAGAVLLTGEEKPMAVEERASVVEPSKLARLADGGKGYVVRVAVDGGTETRTVAPDCVRRPEGRAVASCLRREADGGSRDFGALNRFPVSEAVGAGCQPCACAVYAGEDAEEDEDARLTREKGAEGGR